MPKYTTETFKNGKVAYLLRSAQPADETAASAAQVWGQTLTGDSKDSSPVLDSKAETSVCKVKFATKAKAEYAAKYAVRYKATESSFKSAEYKISVIAFGAEPADEVAPVGNYTGRVKIEKEVAENEVVFTISPLDGNSVSATLYLAEYDIIGNLTDKKLGTKSNVDGKTIIKVEKPKTSIYKLMLWDDDCSPIIVPVTALD